MLNGALRSQTGSAIDVQKGEGREATNIALKLEESRGKMPYVVC